MKFRSLIKYRKLFDSSTTERQTKFTRVSCIIRMNLTLEGKFTMNVYRSKKIMSMGVNKVMQE